MAAMAARPSNSGRAPTPPPTAAGATATAGAIVGSGTTGGAAAASTIGRTQPGPAAAWAAPAAQTAARDSDVPKTLRATSGSIERGAAAAAELASSDTAAKAAVYFRINATLVLPRTNTQSN